MITRTSKRIALMVAGATLALFVAAGCNNESKTEAAPEPAKEAAPQVEKIDTSHMDTADTRPVKTTE